MRARGCISRARLAEKGSVLYLTKNLTHLSNRTLQMCLHFIGRHLLSEGSDWKGVADRIRGLIGMSDKGDVSNAAARLGVSEQSCVKRSIADLRSRRSRSSPLSCGYTAWIPRGDDGPNDPRHTSRALNQDAAKSTKR